MIKQECNGFPVQHACQFNWYQNLFLQAMAIGQISCNDADMLSGNMILRYDYLKSFGSKIMLIHALKTYIVLLSNTRRNGSEKFI